MRLIATLPAGAKWRMLPNGSVVVIPSGDEQPYLIDRLGNRHTLPWLPDQPPD
jgi:hypothetical protein